MLLTLFLNWFPTFSFTSHLLLSFSYFLFHTSRSVLFIAFPFSLHISDPCLLYSLFPFLCFEGSPPAYQTSLTVYDFFHLSPHHTHVFLTLDCYCWAPSETAHSYAWLPNGNKHSLPTTQWDHLFKLLNFFHRAFKILTNLFKVYFII